MSSPTWPGPRRSVEGLVAERGSEAVVTACLDLLAGRDVDGQVVAALGGPPARWAVGGGASGPDYWLRLWALRGLLWHWSDAAAPAARTALRDPSWRVREMAAKVATRHGVDAAVEELSALQQDPVARVRKAAHRALEHLTSAGG